MFVSGAQDLQIIHHRPFIHALGTPLNPPNVIVHHNVSLYRPTLIGTAETTCKQNHVLCVNL